MSVPAATSLALAVASGLTLAFALVVPVRGGGPPATRLPAALGLVAVGLVWADGAFTLSAWAPRVPWLVAPFHSLAFAVPPLAYLATLRLARGSERGGGIPAALHFAPVLVSIVSLVPWFLAPPSTKSAYLSAMAASWPPRLEFSRLALLLLLLGQSVAYAAASARVLGRDLGTEEDEEPAEIHTLRRIRRTFGRHRISAGAAAALLVVVQVTGAHRPGLVMAVVAVAAWPLFVLAAGLLRLPAATRGGIVRAGRPRYRKAELPAATAIGLLDRLRRVLEEQRPWLDPEFAQPALAAALGISPHQLSQLLNRELGVSFTELARRLRVREACRILADPDLDDRTMLAVALDAGFGSKATFNQAFRDQTGRTPSEWRGAARNGNGIPETCPLPWDRDDTATPAP